MSGRIHLALVLMVLSCTAGSVDEPAQAVAHAVREFAIRGTWD